MRENVDKTLRERVAAVEVGLACEYAVWRSDVAND